MTLTTYLIRLTRAPLLVLGAAALLGGCTVGRLGPTPDPSAIAHPTGAADLVLRVFVGGGFVPPGYLVTEAPGFSLYGDGRLIFREAAAAAPTPAGGVIQGAPFRSVKLSEAQVQAVLADALYTGGLAKAQSEYVLPVADAPSTVFTFDAGGVRGQVTVNGLGLTSPPNVTDGPILSALAALRDRLLAYGATVAASTAWVPERYRAYLLDVNGATATPIPWPWTTFSPSTWTNVTDESSSLPWPTRVMTPAEVNALGLGPLGGGATGIVVRFGQTSGATLYQVSLRPLLPDESS